MVAFLLFQLNYLNLALDLFSAAAVSPVYYVFFTSCTIVANTLLFQGLVATSLSFFLPVLSLTPFSLVCRFEGQTTYDMVNDLIGFLAMVIGVFLLYHPKTSAPSQGEAPSEQEEHELSAF